jgi:hypothetical protein
MLQRKLIWKSRTWRIVLAAFILLIIGFNAQNLPPPRNHYEGLGRLTGMLIGISVALWLLMGGRKGNAK